MRGLSYPDSWRGVLAGTRLGRVNCELASSSVCANKSRKILGSESLCGEMGFCVSSGGIWLWQLIWGSRGRGVFTTDILQMLAEITIKRGITHTVLVVGPPGQLTTAWAVGLVSNGYMIGDWYTYNQQT